MKTISETLAHGLVRRTIRELQQRLIHDGENEKISKKTSGGPKRNKREINKLCASNNRCIFFEERYVEKSRWQIIWGSWGLCADSRDIESLDEINRMAFNLFYSHKNGMEEGQFNVILSNHALVRLIMRSGKDIGDANDVLDFLKPITKSITYAGLSRIDGNHGRIINACNHLLPFEVCNDNRTIVILSVLRDDFDHRVDHVIDSALYLDSIFDYSVMSDSGRSGVFSPIPKDELASLPSIKYA